MKIRFEIELLGAGDDSVTLTGTFRRDYDPRVGDLIDFSPGGKGDSDLEGVVRSRVYRAAEGVLQVFLEERAVGDLDRVVEAWQRAGFVIETDFRTWK